MRKGRNATDIKKQNQKTKIVIIILYDKKMKDITILEGIKKIIPLFKRSFRAREVLSLLEYSEILSNINEETIKRCLINLTKDNIILKSDFSDRINDDYYTLPSEKVKYKMEFSSKTNLYHDKSDKGTKLGTVYQIQMKNFELIELCGLSKLFKTYGSESVDGMYNFYDKIHPSQVPRLGSEEFFIIHDYNDEIDYEISDENNTITINSYRYGSYAQFVILNNWNCVERIRKQYIGYGLVDKDYIFPVDVELMITDHKPNTVDFILRQLRLLNSPKYKKTHKMIRLFNSPIDEKTHKIDKGVILLEQDLQRINDLKKRQIQLRESRRQRIIDFKNKKLKIYLRKGKTKSEENFREPYTKVTAMSVLPFRSDKTLQQLKNEGIVELRPHMYRSKERIHHLILLYAHKELTGHFLNNLIHKNSITEFSLSNKIEIEIEYRDKNRNRV